MGKIRTLPNSLHFLEYSVKFYCMNRYLHSHLPKSINLSIIMYPLPLTPETPIEYMANQKQQRNTREHASINRYHPHRVSSSR